MARDLKNSYGSNLDCKAKGFKIIKPSRRLKPFATSQALYLSIVPSGFNFNEKTHLDPMTFGLQQHTEKIMNNSQFPMQP